MNNTRDREEEVADFSLCMRDVRQTDYFSSKWCACPDAGTPQPLSPTPHIDARALTALSASAENVAQPYGCRIRHKDRKSRSAILMGIPQTRR